MSPRLSFALALSLLVGSGCKRPRAGAGTSDAGPPDAGASTVTVASTSAATADAAPADDAVPDGAGNELTRRAKHLLESIENDDASLAADLELPRSAWLADRDARDPGKDWDRRVDRPFRRDIHALWRRGAARAPDARETTTGAELVSLELGRALAITKEPPRRHGWKTAMWTVRGSRLTYVVGGHTRTLLIREMVAWRGAWYVTKLR